MKNALWTAMLGFCLVACIGLATQGSDEETPIMPTELIELAKAHGYAQVSNFYRIRPGYTEAPFVYGYDESKRHYQSVAFCCQRQQDSADAAISHLILVAVEDNYLTGFEIVAEIEWHFPLGLSIVRDSTIPLSRFVYLDSRGYVDEKSEPGPEGVYMEGNAICGEYEDYRVIFYKHQGRWLAYESYDE
ncbi:MAG: hypothetical protein AB1483_08255 [Candidatus Zixiibacteriota bacterium]